MTFHPFLTSLHLTPYPLPIPFFMSIFINFKYIPNSMTKPIRTKGKYGKNYRSINSIPPSWKKPLRNISFILFGLGIANDIYYFIDTGNLGITLWFYVPATLLLVVSKKIKEKESYFT